jgi:hypothetical protein
MPGTRAEGLLTAVMCFATMAVTLILQEMCLHHYALACAHMPVLLSFDLDKIVSTSVI